MAGIEDLTPAQLREFRLGQELMKDPAIRLQALRLAKAANPALHLPEVDLEDRIVKVTEDAKAREQKLSDELMTERVTRRQNERNAQIREAGFQVADIEKIIVDEKCSYETAMKLAAAERRSAEPTSSHTRGRHQHEPIEMRPAEDWRKAGSAGTGGLRKKSAQVAAEMIDQLRSGQRIA